MGLGDERLVDAQAVSATLRCSICTEVYEQPVFSSGKPCQHVFCHACINRALNMRASCPICRAPMQKKHLQPHPVMQSLLDELQVRCESGCAWAGRQDSHAGHLENCPARLLRETQQRLSQTSADFCAQLERRDQEIASLRRQVSEQASRYSRLWQEMSRWREETSQKKRRIMQLEMDLEVARSCAATDAAASLAELQAQAAKEALEVATLAAQKAKSAAEAARQRACQAKEMQLFVKDVQGKTQVCAVEPSATVSVLKSKIKDKIGTPAEAFFLIYRGKVLEDDDQVASYGISRDSTVNMSYRLRSAPRKP